MFKIGTLFLQKYIQLFLLKSGIVVLILKAVTGCGGKACYFYFWNQHSVTAILIMRQQIPCGCPRWTRTGRVPAQASQLRTQEAQVDRHVTIWIPSSGLVCGFFVADLRKHKTKQAWILASWPSVSSPTAIIRSCRILLSEH